MPRLIPALLLLATLAAHAQAPIERRAPEPSLTRLQIWPTNVTAPPGTVLFVTLQRDPGNLRLCRVIEIQPDLLLCHGPHTHDDFEFARTSIATLVLAPSYHRALKAAEIGAFFVGAGSFGLGTFCGIDGGPVCRNPTIGGASLMATAGALHLVSRNRVHHAVLLYAAP